MCLLSVQKLLMCSVRSFPHRFGASAGMLEAFQFGIGVHIFGWFVWRGILQTAILPLPFRIF